MLGKILRNVNQIWFQNESPKSISFVPRVNIIKIIVSGWSTFLSRYYKQFTAFNDDCDPTYIQKNTKLKNTLQHTECYFGEENLKTIKNLQRCNILQNITENNQVYGGIFNNSYNLRTQNDQKNCNIINLLRNENLEGKNKGKENTLIEYNTIGISENEKCLGKKDDDLKYNAQQAIQEGRMKLNNTNSYSTIENRVRYFDRLGSMVMVHILYPNNFPRETNQPKNIEEKLGKFFDKISFKRLQTYFVNFNLIQPHDDTIDLNSTSTIKTKFSKSCRSLKMQAINDFNCLKLLQLDKSFISSPERVTLNQLSDFCLLKRSMSTSNSIMKSLTVDPPVIDKTKTDIRYKTKPKINEYKLKRKIRLMKKEKKMEEKICGRKTSSITCCDVCHIIDDCTIKEKPKRGKSSPYVKIGCPGGLRGIYTSIHYLFKRDTRCKVKPLYPRRIHKPKLRKKKRKKIKTKNEDCMGKVGKGRIRSSLCLDEPKICKYRTASCLELCVCNAKTQTPLERAREQMDCKPPPRTTKAKRHFKYDSSDLGIKCRRRFFQPKLWCGRRFKKTVQPRRKQVPCLTIGKCSAWERFKNKRKSNRYAETVQPRQKEVQYLTIGKCSAWKRFKNMRKRKYRDLL